MARKTKKTTRRSDASDTTTEASTGVRRFTSGQRDALIILVYGLLSLTLASVPIWNFVYPEGRAPRLAGPDAYHHLRHTEAVLAHYPVVARHDLNTNFPYGETGLNQGFFDVAMATIVLITGLSPVTVLIWISPLIVVAIGVGGYFWLSRATNWRCGLLYLLFFLLYPSALTSMASLGQGDHHAAEVLQALAVAWGLTLLLRPETHWKWAPVAVLPLFIFYLSWAGTALHLALVGAVFYVRAWRPEEDETSRDLILKGSLYGMTLLILVMLTKVAAPWAVIWATSERVFMLASALLTLGYPALVLITRRPWKMPWLLAIAIPVVLFAVAFVIPTTRDLLMPMLETRTQQVAEHVAVNLPQIIGWLGLTWVPALFAPVKIWFRKGLWQAMVPLVYGGGLVFFWLQTRDFAYYASPIVAASAAYALEGLALTWSAPLITLFLVLPALITNKSVSQPWMTMPMIRETMMYSDGMEETSAWLKQTQGDIKPDSPNAFGLVTPWDIGNILAQSSNVPVGWSQTVSPELAQIFYSDNPDQVYAQLTDNGRRLRYILLPARNLSEKFLGEMFAANLTAAEMFADEQIVEVDGRTMKTLKPTPRNLASFIVRLYWDLAENLGHYRMVYESPTQAIHATRFYPEIGNIEFHSFTLTKKTAEIFKVLLLNPNRPLNTSRGWMMKARQAPEVRLFEAVPGALVEGSTQPGTAVRATVDLLAPTTSRAWTSTYQTTADEKGTYQLRLPYPTDKPMSAAAGTVEVKAPYKLTVGGQTGDLEVSEADIQRGKKIPLSPSLLKK